MDPQYYRMQNPLDGLPEYSSSSDTEDYNPFQFQSHDMPTFERIFELHFAVKDRKQVLVPREKLALIQRGLKKLKRWFGVVRKEHMVFAELEDQYLVMKSKVDHYNQILASIELQAQTKYDQLNSAFSAAREEYQKNNDGLRNEVERLTEELTAANRKIAKQERSIKMLIDDEASLYERKQKLTEEVQQLKREIQNIKSIKNLGVLDITVKNSTMSTFELVLNSRVKGYLIPFFTLPELSHLMVTSKSLYLAIAPPKTLVPQALKLKLQSIHRELHLMKEVEAEYKAYLNTASIESVRSTMHKVFLLKINLTDHMQQPMKDALQLINGDQFIGATSIRTDMHQFQDNIDHFLQQQSQYSYFVSEHFKGEFPWKQFFNDIASTNPEPRSQLSMKLQVQAQSLTQRLFELGTLCSGDAGIFGMYLSQLQKVLGQVFVFAQYLSLETQQLQTMCYFMMARALQNFKREKRTSEEYDDLKEKMQAYSDSRTFLNARVQDVERSLHMMQRDIVDKTTMLTARDQQIAQLNEKLEQMDRQQSKQQDQLKTLALKTLTYKNKYNELANLHNELVGQFQGIAHNVSDLVYKY